MPHTSRPEGALEEAIAAVFRQVLGINRVGIHDNFFDLGAHSLLIVQAQRKLRETLDRDVPAILLFQYPTIAALAAHLGDRPHDDRHAATQQIRDRVAQQKAARRRRGSEAR